MSENVQAITASHENYGKLEIGTISWRKTLVEVKIQKGISQGGSFSPRLFVFAMIPLNYILRKYTVYRMDKFTKSEEKINHIIYIGDIKIFT